MSIENKYNKVIGDLEAVLSYPWDNSEFYAAWLAQTYYYTSRATRLLLMAAAHCKMDQSVLHRRLAIHAGEEKGHELLAERDLKDLGFDVKNMPEFTATVALYATQFYKVQNESVDVFMGWVLPMEGIAIEYGAKIREKACSNKSQKVPTRFLDIHVDEDPGHMESAFKAIKALKPESQEMMLQNMEVTKDLYLGMLDACHKQVMKGAKKRAA